MNPKSEFERRVLIVAPLGRDGENASVILAKHDIPTLICRDVPDMCARAREGAGALLFTEETLTPTSVGFLEELLLQQPPWSDIPLILLTTGIETTPLGLAGIRALEPRSSMTVLERPLRVYTLVSAVKAALRARARQYQVRDLVDQSNERARILEASQRELWDAKEKISRHAEELEIVVAERTAKLRETIAQLEAFSYSISHDMRAPLRVMQQYSRILLEENKTRLEPDSVHYLDRIAKAANRLDVLIQDVLTYSRIARTEVSLGKIDLDKLVPEILAQYPAFQAPIANIEIEQPLGEVLAHEATLTQCISNLVANAVKFVKPGETPHVRIRASGNNGTAKIWFEDNGIGISPQNQGRIFNIFERINPDSEYEGTGIGLSIVKKTVERMGGEVGVESELGRGSKFWIKLRRAHSQQQLQSQTQSNEQAA